jgi:hypothetical protein
MNELFVVKYANIQISMFVLFEQLPESRLTTKNKSSKIVENVLTMIEK